MSTKLEILRKYIRELIQQELDEASVTGAIDGGEGPPKTPYAFSGGRKKDKIRKRRLHKQLDIQKFTKVSTTITEMMSQ